MLIQLTTLNPQLSHIQPLAYRTSNAVQYVCRYYYQQTLLFYGAHNRTAHRPLVIHVDDDSDEKPSTVQKAVHIKNLR